jgi:sugar/nucleoside kinase (ribokinase family)
LHDCTNQNTGDGLPGVLCSGNIVFDIVLHPVEDSPWGTTTFVESLEYHVGGNGANTALALAAMGVPVRLMGMVGPDDQGRFVLEKLLRAGVDTSAVGSVAAPTASTVVMVNPTGDRRFLHRIGASADAFVEPVEFTVALTAAMSHYHLGSIFTLPRMQPHAAETLRRARTAGLSTSLDTNWDPNGLWMEVLRPLLPHLDLLFLNEDEARMITGSANPAAAAKVVLAGGVRIAVIKLGHRGCSIHIEDEEILCPAFDVEAKDTTGAGDCFAGGFLAARARGVSLEEAGRFANAVAALSVQRIGSAVDLPSYNEVQLWMRSAPVRGTVAR